jgi:hypothetical protein
VFRTLHTQCRTELDLQNQSPFSKDHSHLSRLALPHVSASLMFSVQPEPVVNAGLSDRSPQ